MKRFLTITLAMALVAMFAVPAMADFKMGSETYVDMGYWFQDEDRPGLTSDKWDAFLDTAQYSRLNGTWFNENMSAYMEVGMGREANSTNVNFRKLFGTYKFGTFKFLAGETELIGSSEKNVSQLLGEGAGGKIIGLGFGNLYTRTTQARIEQRTGIWYWGISANTPIVVGDMEGQPYSPTWLWAGVFGVRSKMFWATLGGNISYTATDDEPAGADDSVTAWLIDLHTDIKLGFVNIRVHPYYGQNIQNLGYALLDDANAVAVDANGQIENTDCWGGYVDVTIGGDPFVVHLMGGISVADNDFYTDSQERWFAGVRGAYKVGANFTISPEFGYYDYGDNQFGGADNGFDWVGGVQFQFIF